MDTPKNRYARLVEKVFFKHYKKGCREVAFLREDLETAASELGMKLPKNLGDILYSFRHRTQLPESITKLAPKDLEWVIRLTRRYFCNI